MKVGKDDIAWYAMRAAYCGEMKARRQLMQDGVECYVPTRIERVPSKTAQSGAEDVEVALVHNMIFVRSSRTFLTEYKNKNPQLRLRYMMEGRVQNGAADAGKSGAAGLVASRRTPVVVPDKQMEDFIRVVSADTDGVIYLDNPDVAVEKGIAVEVIAGPLMGVQGQVVRVRRDRRVVVSLSGIVAVAAASMPMSWLKAL